VFRDIWRDVETAISSVIDTITFSDLLEREREKRGQSVIDYQI
jgi:DNA-binding IscR family transcriptional regulator